MTKNLMLKAALIVFLVVFALLEVYPPNEKLKPGLDLAGGTSLIYDIDTTDLSADEKKGLAQRMIPILRRRIDPTNVANIVMRPQGDRRIEIQLPIASADTLEKRNAYEDALTALENQNVNLLTVKRALSADTRRREEIFAAFAGDSETRAAILEDLAAAYDVRKEKQDRRDDFSSRMDKLKDKLDSKQLRTDYVESMASQWSKLDKKARAEAIAEFTEKNMWNSALVEEYIDIYTKWAQIVNELAEPEIGANVKYKQASQKLSQLNLNIQQFESILDMPAKSSQKQNHIAELKLKFSEHSEKIDEVVSAYNEYKIVGGRLDDPQDLKRMLRGGGVLEFRILPTAGDGKTSVAELQGYLESLRTQGPKLASDSRYVWCEVENPQEWGVANAAVGIFGEKAYVLASNQQNECMLPGEKQWKLKKARPTSDQMGRHAIGFVHDEIAARLFYNITKNNIGRPLCILLDGVAISAPTIEEAIRSSGIITGSFTPTKVEDMVNKLNAGSFPARLSEVPVSEKSIGSMIGADNRDKGIRAGLIGMAAVVVFMLIYYIGCGSIADVALIMNLLFVLAMMVMFRATFTLPGIAGIILTIGMSVDANVLIFERIREEQDRGSSLKTAIANGYQKAFRTIFDANITTFITALILYMVASEEIKGFAIVLMLGIASSMFTALFVTRVIFDFLVDKRIIRNHLLMLRLFRKPDINWMGLRGVFVTTSFLLIAGGMFVFFSRDDVENSKYDIEFTGGTSVVIDLKEGTDYSRSDVERIIHDKGTQLGNSALAAAKVYSIGTTGRQYEISTMETNKTTATVTFADIGTETVDTVSAAVQEAAEQSSGVLYNLSVTGDDGRNFVVSTSQVNKALVTEVLKKAFGDRAAVSVPVVNEVVSKAVREAFEGLLEIRQDLGAEITATQEVTESEVELADYLGGIRIDCALKKQTTAGELKDRFRNIRFKRDARNLNWYRYEILDDNLVSLEPEEKINSFVYVSAHPEAGYRDISDNERTTFIENEKSKILMAGSLQTSLSQVTQFDPSIGKQAKTRALLAIVMSLVAIVGYIWIRFGTARYGFAAIVALLHDVCIVLGAVTICTYLAPTVIGKALLIGDFKISLEMVAAFLTIIGYSLNDTIVVFDRIRENRGKLATLNPQIISNSINQTLSRTLLTSFTTFVVVLVMYIWGGEGLRGFTFAMLVGILVGTYSSVAIAAPILLLGQRSNKADSRQRRK